MDNLNAVLAFLGFKYDPNFTVSGSSMDTGDVKLGEMNEFEVSCYSSLGRLDKEREEITKSKDQESDYSKTEESKISSLTENIKTIRELMWKSIKYRFPDAKGDGFALRDGNIIVSITLSEEEKLHRSLASMFGLLGGVHIIEVSSLGRN